MSMISGDKKSPLVKYISVVLTCCFLPFLSTSTSMPTIIDSQPERSFSFIASLEITFTFFTVIDLLFFSVADMYSSTSLFVAEKSAVATIKMATNVFFILPLRLKFLFFGRLRTNLPPLFGGLPYLLSQLFVL